MNPLRRAVLCLPLWYVATAHASAASDQINKGRGWTYTVVERHINVADDDRHASFDELLDNADFGRCRGTGVVRRTGGAWKIEQYHLTIPVPNALADEVVKRIRAGK